ncbi:MAG: hypothetical protein DWQ04_09115 [Chloroflexi bacterium]|nr:MAG: hypothetical protein DWQ04_09115 [Chloroflexota bacterium]
MDEKRPLINLVLINWSGMTPLLITPQVGDKIIAFINETEMGWWDDQPPRKEPIEGGGIAFDFGHRAVLNFANDPEMAYLLRDKNGHYASLPSAYEQWPPMTQEGVADHIAIFRPILTTTERPMPTTNTHEAAASNPTNTEDNLGENGRFLAYTDNNGLNLHDLEIAKNKSWSVVVNVR